MKSLILEYEPWETSMKPIDRKAERTVWIALIASIPFLFLVLWKETGKIGRVEIVLVIITLVIGIGVLYAAKWYSNKN